MSGSADLGAPCDLSEARRLAAQYRWRLLSVDAWVAAARQIDPAPADAKASRRALLDAYAAVLFSACGEPVDSGRREQAYRELYDYLWQQAYYWHPELACDIAQEAVVLVFRSFVEPQLARCAVPAAFLDFAHGKLRDARKRVFRERAVPPNWAPLPEECSPDADAGRSAGRALPDNRPGPEELLIDAETAAETQAERQRWLATAQPRVISAILTSLLELWRKSRLRRQVAAVIHTYIDRASDTEIASCLGTTAVNVQPLRSRGLDKLAEQLAIRLALGQGGCP